jgi:hypothetical protein
MDRPIETASSDIKDLYNRFAFHPASEMTGPMHAEVRDRCYALALSLQDMIPPGRHAALALTAIEEAMHWANAAIACDTKA